MDINLKAQWHRALYRFYDGLAQTFLRLEQRYLDNPEKFWPLSDRFEKYHRKASDEFAIYMREIREANGYSVV